MGLEEGGARSPSFLAWRTIVNSEKIDSTRENQMASREVVKISDGQATEDGAGVSLIRYIGSPDLDHIDPFLLLDFFQSDNPDDYIAGFPPHPHRGFETVTYLLAGRVRHEDSTGRSGMLESGGVQWMTAGRGVIHSEMPEQEEGLLAGFQLWVNLPGRLKMSPPRYREFSKEEIPKEQREGGILLRVIAGKTHLGTQSPVEGVATNPLYLDVSLPGGITFYEPFKASMSAFVLVVEGRLIFSANDGISGVGQGQLALLGSGESVECSADEGGARFLLVAGEKIDEPIKRHGPFVMNTEEEIKNAILDFNSGRF